MIHSGNAPSTTQQGKAPEAWSDATTAALWPLIRKHNAFDGISDSALREILFHFQLVSASAGQMLIQEGLDDSAELLLILDGELEVTKKDLHVKEDVEDVRDLSAFPLATLSGGDIIGEFSFITGEVRSATIKTITTARLLSIKRIEFELLQGSYTPAYTQFLKNVMRNMAERAREKSTKEVRNLRLQVESAVLSSRSNLFFSYVIGLLCVYNLVIHFIISLSANAELTSLISALIIVLFAGGLLMMVRHSRLPPSIIGLTTRNWKKGMTETLLWTAFIITASVFVKWILIRTVPAYQGLSLFKFDVSSHKYLAFNFILYGLHSPIQEFIARGVLQGSLQHFFTGRNVAFRAIIVSNALFAATHVHIMNGMLAILVFIPGLFWGWLYARHENLIAVSISHLLIGWTLLFFLDLESLFIF